MTMTTRSNTPPGRRAAISATGTATTSDTMNASRTSSTVTGIRSASRDETDCPLTDDLPRFPVTNPPSHDR
ncbi:hypothetical protein [Microbacterium elymi]|uniref:Uncharacterized protein n=1 Tax=Microbacterium elymi TaxID=2909587 RepID=A0ABY5NI69_9MICO|nr:hypothetical protein [Microbacterium elymi]UUT34882.1 hypothetical protein L2X98_31215 [Microbacterium elymi]